MWLAFAVSAMMSIGAADFSVAIAGRRTEKQSEILSVTWTQHAIGIVLIAVAVGLVDTGSPDANDLRWGVATGLAMGVAKPLYFAGLSFGSIAIFAPVTAVFAIIVPVGASLLQGETPGALSLAGILVAIPAIIVVGSRKAVVAPRWPMSLVIVAAVASGALFGLGAVTVGEMNEDAGLEPLLLAFLIMWIFLTLGTLAARARLLAPPQTLLPCVLSGTLAGTGLALITLALQRGEVSVAATILALAPVITVILAWLFLHDHLDKTHKIAIGLTFLAVVMMSAG